jgi:hypothetical protein
MVERIGAPVFATSERSGIGARSRLSACDPHERRPMGATARPFPRRRSVIAGAPSQRARSQRPHPAADRRAPPERTREPDPLPTAAGSAGMGGRAERCQLGTREER